jgi:hypothetical protein
MTGRTVVNVLYTAAIAYKYRCIALGWICFGPASLHYHVRERATLHPEGIPIGQALELPLRKLRWLLTLSLDHIDVKMMRFVASLIRYHQETSSYAVHCFGHSG